MPDIEEVLADAQREINAIGDNVKLNLRCWQRNWNSLVKANANDRT
jgi:hypothetical protein